MSSKREQILAAIMASLTGTAGVGSRIYRSRVAALDRAQSPAIVVRPKAETEPVENFLNIVDRLFTFTIDIITRGNEPDSLADPIITDAHKRIMADLTLGGLSLEIREGKSEFQIENADQDLCLLTVEYTVWYRTTKGDLTQ